MNRRLERKSQYARRLMPALFLVIAAVVQAGCSRGYQLETASVRGTITLDGKPVSAGTVVFTPARGRGATGALSSDGTFVLSTYGNNDGAIVGQNKVVIAPPPEDERGNHPPGYVAIPQRYQNGESSGLKADVKLGEDNVFDFQLTSTPAP
jgi:hypothetical protein